MTTTTNPRKYYVKKVSAGNYHILPVTNTDKPDQHLPTQTKEDDKTTESIQHSHTRTTAHDDNPTQQRRTKLTQEVNEVTKSTRQGKPPPEIKQLRATLQLDKRNRMLYVPLQFPDYENQGLLDNGVIQSAMSENELHRKTTAHPAALLKEYPAPDFKVQIANGSIVPVRKQVLLRFFIGGKIFEETFTNLPTMGTF